MELRFSKAFLVKQEEESLFSILLRNYRLNSNIHLYTKEEGTPAAMAPIKWDAANTLLYSSGVIAPNSGAKFYVFNECIIPKHYEKQYGWAKSLDCLERPPFYYKATTIQPEYVPRTELPPSSGIIISPPHDLITNSFDLVWDKSVSAVNWDLKIINKTSGVTIRQDSLTVDSSGANNVSKIDNFPLNTECYLVLYGDSVFVDSKIVEYIPANGISIQSPNNGIYDDDVDVVFTVPSPYVMTLTKYGEGVIPFELPPSHLIHLQDVPINLTTIEFEGYAVDGDAKFYYKDSSLFDPLILPSVEVVGNSLIATTKWNDDLSWTLLIRSEDNSILYWYQSNIAAGTRNFPLPLLPNNNNYDVTLQYVKDTGNQSISTIVPSPTATVTKSGDIISWTSLPLLDSVTVEAIYNGQVVDSVTKAASATSSHTFTNIPQGLAGYITYRATYKKYGKESYAEASFLENPTVFTLPTPYTYQGDEILVKWNQITGTHDSLKLTTSDGVIINMQPNEVEQWVPVASIITLYKVENNQETLLEAGLFSGESIGLDLVSDTNIPTQDYTLEWSPATSGLAWIRAGLLTESPTLSSSATSYTFNGLPVDPAVIEAYVLFEYNGTRHKKLYTLNNTRISLNLISPDSIFSGTSHRITWEVTHDITGYPYQYSKVEVINDAGVSIISKNVASPIAFVDVDNLPLTGEQLTVRLTGYTTNGATTYVEQNVVAASTYPVYPEISSPSPFYNLTSPSPSITIDRKGIAISSWSLRLGTTSHGNDLFQSGNLSLNSPQAVNIPLIETGQTVYATLQFVLENQNQVRSYQRVFTTSNVPAKVVRTFLHSKLGTYTLEPHGQTVTDWGITLLKNGNTLYELYPIQGNSIDTSAHEIFGENYQLIYKINGSSSQPVVLLEDVGDVDIVNPTLITTNSFAVTWNNNDVVPDSWKVIIKNEAGIVVHSSEDLPSNFSSYSIPDVSITGSELTIELGYKYGTHDYIYTTKVVPTDVLPRIVSTQVVTAPSRGVGVSIASNNAPVDHYDLYMDGVLVVANIPANQTYIFVPTHYNGDTHIFTLETTLTDNTTVTTPPSTQTVPLDYPLLHQVERPSLTEAIIKWHVGDLPVANFFIKAGLVQGGDDLLATTTLTGTTDQFTLSNLPLSPNNTVFYTLSFDHNGSPQELTDSFDVMPKPYFVVPTAPLQGADTGIILQDPSGIVDTWKVVINSESGSQLFDSGFKFNSQTTFNAYNLPIDGSTLNFKILYTLQGVAGTFVVEHPVIAYSTPAIPDSYFTTQILDENGKITIRIPDYEYNFQWSDGGVSPTNYRVIMGSTPNSSNKYNSGLLSGAARSHLVTGIPDTGEDLYLTLIWYV